MSNYRPTECYDDFVPPGKSTKASIGKKYLPVKPTKIFKSMVKQMTGGLQKGQSINPNVMAIEYFSGKMKPKGFVVNNSCPCPVCGDELTIKNISKEHVLPKHKGGKKQVWCCVVCNQMKGGMTINEFLQHIAKISVNNKLSDKGWE